LKRNSVSFGPKLSKHLSFVTSYFKNVQNLEPDIRKNVFEVDPKKNSSKIEKEILVKIERTNCTQ